MNGERRSRRTRVVALIAPGDGPHLVSPGVVPIREWTRSPRSIRELGDALADCLSLLRDDPRRFERAAIGWHARWCSSLPALTLAEAQAALNALSTLQGAGAVHGARELRRLCVRYGMQDTAEVLRRWMEQVGAPRGA
jgi:hypothetical protein